MKTCVKCLKELPIENFYIRNKKTNLRRTMCKDCMYEESKQYKELHKEKISQQLKDYNIANTDKLREYRIKYNAENKERIAITKREYYDENIEKRRDYNAEYYTQNREKIIQQSLAYSKTEKGIASKKNVSNRRRLIKRDGNVDTNIILEMKNKNNKCYWCNNKLVGNNYHLDHYIPLSKGGKHTIENIVISCPTCNIRKSNKDPYKFALSVGKLL